jgi:ornithine decarboxylase
MNINTNTTKVGGYKKIPKYLTTFAELPKFLRENDIKLFSTEEFPKRDIINYYLEQNKVDEAFFLIDLGEVLEQYKTWKTLLPRVEPFYAVKCCPNPMVLKLLDILGCGFDCASKTEIINVTDLNVQPNRIIYANPVKDPHFIKFARSQNVDLMTFDSECELYKVKLYHPYAKLVIRIRTDDSLSCLKFSTKFGASLQEAKLLIEKAKSLEINIVGVSFHVGSKCNAGASFSQAIQDAKEVFEMGKANGMNMNLLDIGGGFPGHEKESKVPFEEMAKSINDAIDQHFSDVSNLRIIAEPGRFFASKSHTMVFNVIGKKKHVYEGETRFQYYMNDGVYGCFNCIMFDGATPEINAFHTGSGHTNEKLYKTTMFGPTCDSVDTILKDVELPELCVGEWCYVQNFGAYTMAAASNFNGFTPVDCFYIMTY